MLSLVHHLGAGAGCLETRANETCAGPWCTDAELYSVLGNCLADPPADSACTAEEVTVASAAVVAEEDPEGISDDCQACVFTRTLRKGVDDVATSDIELCGPPAADAAKATDAAKASSAFATGACLTALVATAVAM